MKKLLALPIILLPLILMGFFIGKPTLERWMMSVPATPFDKTPLPEAPDYSKKDSWSALPWQADSADWVPANTDFSDQQQEARVDVFFVYPTAAFYGDYWVAGLDNLLHRVSVDYGIQSQHTTAFNGVAKIYAPRYRSVRMAIWGAEDKASVKKATALAYSDVKRAFEHYLKNWNQGRPFIIVSHSQGTLHTIRLLREMVDGKALQKQFVAGYLIGNTIADMPWFQNIPLCDAAEKTGCFATWNTVLEGGDSYHWVKEKGLEKIYCVNPLSWKADTVAVDKKQNPGSIPMIGAGALVKDIGPVHKQLVGARCGDEGILWISNRPAEKGYTAALFEGDSYHTYDINLFWASIRANAKLRVEKFLNKP